jgi:hypothetical protein
LVYSYLGTYHPYAPSLLDTADISEHGRLTSKLVYRYFPYLITVSALTVGFLGMLLWLISQRRLLPSIVIIGAFMFFVLWMVGLIVVSMELWGPQGSVSSNCNLLVFSQTPTPGNNQANLAWLEQKSICKFYLRLSPTRCQWLTRS